MKTSLALILLSSCPLIAQEAASPVESAQAQEPASMETQTGIPGKIADGKISQQQVEREQISFDILSSTSSKRFVSQAPELPGLPPVEGTIQTTIQLVTDPGLTDPLPALPRLEPDDPAVLARLAETREEHKETRMLFVSATVIDHQKTVLSCHPNGDAAGQVSVVSNIDFNDFSGFDTFNVKGINQETGQEEVRKYALIMAISNEDTVRMAKLAARRGGSYSPATTVDPPASTEPSFVVTEGDDKDALQAIADLHELYKKENERMKAARIAREKAYEERKAYLLANPPKPQNVTFKFWKRNQVAPLSGLQENGGNQ